MTVFCNLTSKLKNAQQFNREFIVVPKTALCLNFLKLLCLAGFISGVVEINSGQVLKVNLKHQINGAPNLKEIKLLFAEGKSTYLCYPGLNQISSLKIKQLSCTFFRSPKHHFLNCLKNIKWLFL